MANSAGYNIVLPPDGEIMPSSHLADILSGDGFPETTGFRKSVEFVDFDWHGKPFTQVVTLLRPERPRTHGGREIVVIAGEGGKDNGNAFLTTYEGKDGIGPWLARRGVTFVAVPRLGRWNFFDPDGNWQDIPLSERMPVFTRHQDAYWSPNDYMTHASTGQASRTGSDTWRRPREGTALYEHMLAATPDAIVEGYRRGTEHALKTIGRKRDEAMLLFWGFSTGGPFLWALNRFLAADGMMGWATSNTGISYYYGRTTTGNYDWGYEDSVLRVRERGRPDFRFYTEHLPDDRREKLWQEALKAPNFKSVEDTSMFFNVAALAEQASRLWHAGFLPPDEIETGYAALVQQVMEPCFPAPQLRDVAVWEMNGTLDQVIQPWRVDAARAAMERYCKRYRVARLEGFRHDIMHDTMRTVGQIWLTVIESGYFD